MNTEERKSFRQIIEASVNIVKFSAQKPDAITVGYGVIAKTLALLDDVDRLEAENAALRDRVERIEKAAREVSNSFHEVNDYDTGASLYVAREMNPLWEGFDQHVAALRSALDGVKP